MELPEYNNCLDCKFYIYHSNIKAVLIPRTNIPFMSITCCNRAQYVDNTSGFSIAMNLKNERMGISNEQILALYPDDYEPCGVKGKFFKPKPEPDRETETPKIITELRELALHTLEKVNFYIPNKENMIKKLKELLCRT